VLDTVPVNVAAVPVNAGAATVPVAVTVWPCALRELPENVGVDDDAVCECDTSVTPGTVPPVVRKFEVVNVLESTVIAGVDIVPAGVPALSDEVEADDPLNAGALFVPAGVYGFIANAGASGEITPLEVWSVSYALSSTSAAQPSTQVYFTKMC
jgi:hypothetical protein